MKNTHHTIAAAIAASITALAFAAGSAHAQNGQAVKVDSAAASAVTPFQKTADPGMMAQMQSLYPSTVFREVNNTAVPGIFEVVMGKNTAYVDQSGRYFMFGRLFDMQTQTDLTPAKPEPVEKVELTKLDTKNAIKKVKGTGARVLYVFSDPDCPFCQQLERNIANLDNVTIYTFLYPLEGLHPDAKRKSVNIWCSSDQAKAWDGFMLSGALPANANCTNPVDQNIALAQQYGINGTPTLIAADGRKMAGALSADRLSAWLDAGTGTGTGTVQGAKQ